MADKNRYEAIDGWRAYACLGIVAMHVLANGKYGLDGFIYVQFIPALTNLVFLFMTISAFGMCCGYYDRMISDNVDIVSFYKKRYKKILPFFALLCLLDFIVSPSINSLYEVFANLTLCFGLIPNADITVIGVGWFLGTVFVFYLMFPFFCFLLADKKRAWLGFTASFIMNILCISYFDVDRKSIAYSFVYFMVGGIVFLYREEISKLVKFKCAVIIVFISLVTIYYFVESNTAISLLINAMVLVLAIVFVGKGVLNNKFVHFIGGISFEIYLCHMFIFRVLEKANMLRLTQNNYVNYWLIYLIVFIGATVFAYISQIGINKVTKFLIKE
ncbi:MAG: acyltransferase [Pseudobutyrivibrio ruminis]|uniref:Acyltransferase n=1 Tax=Pseudobutyrivibrio ruminis TaxID=46206 RepID=A0A927UAN0_9FIRM|nr:acyltransferase [Pseudobutyrivibrio ruminis]